jgi:hypothetical protein
MFRLGRAVLLVVAILSMAIISYKFAWTMWGVLDSIPDDMWIAGLGLMWCIAIVAYTRWVWGKLRKPRRRVVKKDYPRKQVVAVLSEPAPSSMEQLESDVHDWSTRGDTPGSLAGSAIGLDAIDDFLEGDM